jgi:Holliday junction DNA helicase RuvA
LQKVILKRIREEVESVISFVRGELVEVLETTVIIDCNGMGYEVYVPQTVYDTLPGIGQTVKLHTYMQVKEDLVALFGFTCREDLSVFKLLITVNGIGPKGALGILSAISINDLRFAILAEDAKAIARAPGIGAKTASKLILELKDKFKLEEAFEASFNRKHDLRTTVDGMEGVKEEAIQALIALGYSSTEALKAVRSVELVDGITSEDLIKKSLKKL